MEFMRTKEVPFDMMKDISQFDDAARLADGRAILRNTYNVCDKINALDWSRCAEKQSVVAYTRNLIALRKAHPAFRLADGKQLVDMLAFMDNEEEELPKEVLAWRIDGKKCGDDRNTLLILANPLSSAATFVLPESGEWNLITDGISFAPPDSDVLKGGSEVTLAAKTLSVYVER